MSTSAEAVRSAATTGARKEPAEGLDPRSDAATPVLSADQQLQLAWEVFVSVEHQVQVADRKVQAIFGANALLAAALSFSRQKSLTAMAGAGIGPLEWIGLAACLFLLGSVCASAAFALMALLPRVRKSSPAEKRAPRPLSSFFFGDIAAIEEQQFVAHFLEVDARGATERILVQVHRVSQILQEKYYWTRRAARALLLSLLLWIVVLIAQFIR